MLLNACESAQPRTADSATTAASVTEKGRLVDFELARVVSPRTLPEFEGARAGCRVPFVPLAEIAAERGEGCARRGLPPGGFAGVLTEFKKSCADLERPLTSDRALGAADEVFAEVLGTLARLERVFAGFESAPAVAEELRAFDGLRADFELAFAGFDWARAVVDGRFETGFADFDGALAVVEGFVAGFDRLCGIAMG